MKCSGFLAAAAILCQIVIASPLVRVRRGYIDRNPDDQSIVIIPEHDTVIHHQWYQGPKRSIKHEPLRSKGSFDYYEAFGTKPDGYGDGSSEEEFTGYSGPKRSSGYGYGPGQNWWRPTVSTIKRSIPTKPLNSEGSKQTFVAWCIRSCPVTTEYDPVCGSNNVTYQNIGRLECERNCGVAVLLKKRSPCSSPDQVTEKPSANEEQIACLRSCYVTGEYNPVCGTNNVTYSNPGRLECAINCGVQVKLHKSSACSVSEPTSPSPTTEVFSIAKLTAACIRSCPVTNEYNPICGSNHVTYGNPGRLECAQMCGVDVKISRLTSCVAPITKEERVNHLNTNTSTTTELNSIPTTSTSRPYVNVNGGSELNSENNDIKTNGSSYNNINGNKWEVNNTENVTASNNSNNFNKPYESTSEGSGKGGNGKNGTENDIHSGNNNGGGLEDISADQDVKENQTKARPSANENHNCREIKNKKPPSVKELMECMQTCTLSSEPNPVCGTDSITYMNPGRLLCAQFCGVNVQLKKFAPCNSDSITNVHCLTPCTNPPATENPSISTIEACMKACPTSMKFKPVCGSNNVTYRNLEILQCARRCGVDVSLKKSAHCVAPDIQPNFTDTAAFIQECIQQCSVPQKYDPICGSDGVTYNNTGHLICARQCGLDIQVKQLYPCDNSNVSPTSSTSTTTENVPTVTPGLDGLNFTIDPAILANIWPVTTGATPKNEDEDFEVDQRIQDSTNSTINVGSK